MESIDTVADRLRRINDTPPLHSKIIGYAFLLIYGAGIVSGFITAFPYIIKVSY